MSDKWFDGGYNDRDWQLEDTVYELPDGTAFYTPDGEGRIYYDSLDDAYEDTGHDVSICLDENDDLSRGE